MISINRLEEMAIEELQTELKNFKEQIKLQNNFIDSLLKATNNSEWLNKSMLDDEVSEVIEKIELDYKQLDQLKAENDELRKNLVDKHTSRCFRLVTHREFNKLIMEKVQLRQENKKLKQTLTEIKEFVENMNKECFYGDFHCADCDFKNGCTYQARKQILQKINEVVEE